MKGKLVFKGGKGSGNFGHLGRPGKVGGSGGGYVEVGVTAVTLAKANIGDKYVYYSKAGKPSYGTIIARNADGSVQVQFNKDKNDPDSQPSPTAKSSARLSSQFATENERLLVANNDSKPSLPMDPKKADEMWFEYDEASVIKAISRGDANPTSGSMYNYTAAEIAEASKAATTLQYLAATENSGHTTVYRGASMLPEYISEYTKVGSVIPMRGLTATSPLKDIAFNYTDDQYSGGEGKPIMFKIVNSSGIIGHNTSTGFADTGGETLLAHDSKYKIISANQSKHMLNVTLQQLRDKE